MSIFRSASVRSAFARLLSQDCVLCGARSHASLCKDCYGDLPFRQAPGCPRCNAEGIKNQLCGACLSDPPHFDETTCAFRYAYPLDRLVQVYKFAEPVTERGFVYMDSPGYDPCSVTGQIASGSNLIAFTTGRGSVSGYKPTPCIKLATNQDMYERMSEDMDVNCGDIITDGISLEEKGREIFELFLRVASGERTKSEELGFGGAEFVPWAMGAVM